uniref:Uncharacterized protein n=1 Tax=Faecalibaculum rodentium TaxID=1702221 RepID=A0A140DX70_9FIRM|nr:hypothetical protein AALO17_21130 [Faecalibaculum rodentium]
MNECRLPQKKNRRAGGFLRLCLAVQPDREPVIRLRTV